MKTLIQLLACGISPCLQKYLVSLFRKLFTPLTDDDKPICNKYIKNFIKNKGLEHLLLYTEISTIDIKLECLQIFEILFKFQSLLPLNFEEYIFPYLVQSIFPLKTPIFKEASPNDSSISQLIQNELGLMTNDTDQNQVSEDGVAKRKKLITTDPDLKKLQYIKKKDYNEYLTSGDIIDLNNINNINRSERKSLTSSLTVIEGSYWKILNNQNMITNLNMPDKYIKHYSNKINDENLTRLIEYVEKWMLDRLDDDKILIDDTDNIKFELGLNLMMKIIMFSKIVTIQSFLQDLFMLTIFNESKLFILNILANCNILYQNKYFYQWLLDIMIPYEILLYNESFRQSKESGIAMTILELGVKIHTFLLMNKIKNHSLNDIDSVSPKLQTLMTWMTHIKKIGIIEGKAATNLVRTLLNSLIEHISKLILTNKINPSVNNSVWLNLMVITAFSFEMIVFSNFFKQGVTRLFNIDISDKNEIFIEIIQNLNIEYESIRKKDSNNSNLLEYNNEIQISKSILDMWLDKDLTLNIYNIYRSIWRDYLEIKKKIVLGLSSSEDSKYCDALFKLIYESKNNLFVKELKVLLFSVKTNKTVHSDNFEEDKISNIMLNLICINIKLHESYSDVYYWVNELECFTLFQIVSSENLKHNGDIYESLLLMSKDSIANNIIISFNFLIDEINSPKRQSSQEIIGN